MASNEHITDNQPTEILQILQTHSMHYLAVYAGAPITSIPDEFISTAMLLMYFQTHAFNEEAARYISSLPVELFTDFLRTNIISLNVENVKCIPPSALNQDDLNLIVFNGGYHLISIDIRKGSPHLSEKAVKYEAGAILTIPQAHRIELYPLAVKMSPFIILQIPATHELIQDAILESNWNAELFTQILEKHNSIDNIPRDVLIGFVRYGYFVKIQSYLANSIMHSNSNLYILLCIEVVSRFGKTGFHQIADPNIDLCSRIINNIPESCLYIPDEFKGVDQIWRTVNMFPSKLMDYGVGDKLNATTYQSLCTLVWKNDRENVLYIPEKWRNHTQWIKYIQMYPLEMAKAFPERGSWRYRRSIYNAVVYGNPLMLKHIPRKHQTKKMCNYIAINHPKDVPQNLWDIDLCKLVIKYHVDWNLLIPREFFVAEILTYAYKYYPNISSRDADNCVTLNVNLCIEMIRHKGLLSIEYVPTLYRTDKFWKALICYDLNAFEEIPCDEPYWHELLNFFCLRIEYEITKKQNIQLSSNVLKVLSVHNKYLLEWILDMYPVLISRLPLEHITLALVEKFLHRCAIYILPIEVQKKYEIYEIALTCIQSDEPLLQKCPVCLDDKCDIFQFPLISNNCGHHICGVCLVSLEKRECPLCRTNISLSEQYTVHLPSMVF